MPSMPPIPPPPESVSNRMRSSQITCTDIEIRNSTIKYNAQQCHIHPGKLQFLIVFEQITEEMNISSRGGGGNRAFRWILTYPCPADRKRWRDNTIHRASKMDRVKHTYTRSGRLCGKNPSDTLFPLFPSPHICIAWNFGCLPSVGKRVGNAAMVPKSTNFEKLGGSTHHQKICVDPPKIPLICRFFCVDPVSNWKIDAILLALTRLRFGKSSYPVGLPWFWDAMEGPGNA